MEENLDPIFKVGKYYKHTTGEIIFICGTVESHTYGRGLMSENQHGDFKMVGDGGSFTANYIESSEDEFLGNNK